VLRLRVRGCRAAVRTHSTGLLPVPLVWLRHTNSMSAAPTCCDVIALICRRYKHCQDSSKGFLVHDLVFSYEAVHNWEAKLTQILSDELRQRRHRNRSTAVSDILSATQEPGTRGTIKRVNRCRVRIDLPEI
jgi:hypothetical protein